MILIPCPYCGPRNSNEFAFEGESRTRPQVATVEPNGWRRYLYDKANRAGWTTETWYHRAGCRKFFVAERDTVTNEVRATRAFAPPAGGEPAT
jgi:heterotetrameric sarcosine oxidase delta subunit